MGTPAEILSAAPAAEIDNDIDPADGAADDRLAREWHELMHRYHQTACRLDRELEAEHGISGSDFEVLQQLFVSGGDACSLRMADLAATCHLSQSALSRLVSRLEKDGLVARTMCEEDRRSVFTAITPAGRELFLAARPTQRRVLRESV